jgi:tetratricopeptide (TPR) repeat protein
MSIDSTLRRAAKLAKAGNRAGAAALYREILAKFPGNASARKGLAALGAPGAAPRPGGTMQGGALGAGLIPGARPVAAPAGLRGGPAGAPQPRRAATAPAAGATTKGGPAPTAQQLAALEHMLNRGDPRAAVTEAKRLAMLFPRSPALLNLLGMAQARTGQHDEALASYDRVLEIDPGFAGAHLNKANAYALLGQFDKVEAEARAALALNPKLAQAHMLLGYGLVNTGRAEAAEAPFKTAVRLAPRMVQPQIGLGNTYAALGRHEDALAAFERARRLEPNNVDVLNNLGNTLISLHRIDEAVSDLEQAAALAPRNVVLLNNLARALRDIGRTPDAIKVCEQVIALTPDSTEAWGLLGGSRLELGDKPGAIEAIDRAVALDPSNIQALGVRWQMDVLPLDHPDLARLTTIVTDDTLPAADRATLELALFKAYDKADQLDEAMAHLHRGNTLRRSAEPYDIDAHRAVFERLKAAFEAGVAPLDAAAIAEVPAPARPVFIVGMPRSGTSLVEQILASHSQVQGAGELDALSAEARKLGWYPGKAPQPLDRTALLTLRRGYLDSLARYASGKPVMTDKTPLNFRHVGIALAAMPEARVLFMQRDSRATCWSNYSNNFTGRANNFGQSMTDTAEMYRIHLDLAAFWQKHFPDRVTVVPYERLTEHQEEESRKLVAAAGLDWEDACLDFHKTKRAVRTVSSTQVRRKMYTGSSQAWQRYADHIRPMLDRLEGLDPA